jgi:hypothetical protein
MNSDGVVELQPQDSATDNDQVFVIRAGGDDGRPILQLKSWTGDVNHLELFWDDTANRAEIRNPVPGNNGTQIRMPDGGTNELDSIFFRFPNSNIRVPVWDGGPAQTVASDKDFTGLLQKDGENVWHDGRLTFGDTDEIDAGPFVLNNGSAPYDTGWQQIGNSFSLPAGTIDLAFWAIFDADLSSDPDFNIEIRIATFPGGTEVTDGHERIQWLLEGNWGSGGREERKTLSSFCQFVSSGGSYAIEARESVGVSQGTVGLRAVSIQPRKVDEP